MWHSSRSTSRKIKRGLALLVLGPVSLGLADEQTQESAVLCRLDDTTTVSQAEAARTPNYFFRPFPNSDQVAYASGKRNYILDLNKGAEVEIPGPYDPVPTPDQMIMTIPPDEGLSFYSVKDLEAEKKEPLLVDADLKGVYQSIGTVKAGNGEKTFRVITDQDGLSFRDYTVKEPRDASEKPAVLKEGASPTVLCKGMRLSLPMLSKDGRQIAALDVNAGVTKIFDLDPSNGSCREAMNLGIPTGKVDFSFDGDSLTFHVLNNSSAGDSYFSVPSDSLVANVFVLKRSTGEITKLTNNTSSNSVFPAFRRDGKIVYLNHPQRSGEPGVKSSFVLADPARANAEPFDLVSTPSCAPKAGGNGYHAVAALGALWAQLCSRFGHEISDSAAALIPLGLDPERCQSLVHAKWKELKGEIVKNPELVRSGKLKAEKMGDLEEADLTAACPKKKFDVVKAGQDSSQREPTSQTPKVPVPRACFECHSDDVPFFDWKRLTTETAASGKLFRDEILDRLNLEGEGRMPPGNHAIGAAEKAAFESYLRTGKP